MNIYQAVSKAELDSRGQSWRAMWCVWRGHLVEGSASSLLSLQLVLHVQ